METLDQQEQWHQLTDTYRHMTEEELCRVADDAFDLVPLAKEALQAVISERGLKIQLAAVPPPVESSDYEEDDIEDDIEEDDDIEDTDEPENPAHRLVCVRTVRSESEAKQLKALLDANFIASCLGPENIVDLEDFKAGFDGGVELKVHSLNSHRAIDALALLAPEEEEEELNEDADYAVVCPKCHSQEVTFSNAVPEAVDTSVETKYNWTCDACGHEWTDEGIAQRL
jgi:DNA-directed RNA polymerase subunit M/transcription elongation factor TFIIS